VVKPQPNFPLDEIVRILTKFPREEVGEGFVTVNEIHDAVGWPKAKIRGLLNILKKRGELELGKKTVVLLNDTVRKTDAYRIKSKEEKEDGI